MEQQIELLYKPLFFYVKNRVDNQEDAEDLTQEVFYKLSKSDTSSVDSIKSWMYTIAKNTITDFYRKKRITTTEMEDVPYSEVPDNDTAAELSSCVRRFVDELPEDYREVMTLSELEGVPQKEIAERLNMNYVTVRSKIQRGRKKLKALISDCCYVIQGGKGSILAYQSKKVSPEELDCCD